MQKCLVALALAGLLCASGVAEDPKPKNTDKKDPSKKEKATKLKVGDAAPALKATKWMQGDEVKSFQAGKVYVVEFWATWCGPCIVMMPHLSEMQQEYKSKGLTIIGFTKKDPNNSEEKVAEFVKKRGQKLKYTFAYADDLDTYTSWMRAAGRNGIPCTFVVNKEGKIAYIGHPMYLDLVIPKVVAGTWDIEKGGEELAKVEKDVNAVFGAARGKDPQTSLATIMKFEKKYPALNKIPYFIGPKLSLLIQTNKINDAKKMAEDVMKRGMEQGDDTALRTVSMAMRTGAAKEHKDLLAMSVKAATAMLKVAGEKDPLALYYAAEAHFAAGDVAKAQELGKKAVEAAENPRLKQQLEQRTKIYAKEKKDA